MEQSRPFASHRRGRLKRFLSVCFLGLLNWDWKVTKVARCSTSAARITRSISLEMNCPATM
jgi:hypothetical protein